MAEDETPDPAASAISFNVHAKYDPVSGDIRLTMPGADWFDTTVNRTKGSKRCHRALYSRLGRALKEAGARSPKKDGTDAAT